MCVALRGRASAGNLLQGAQRCLQGDCHSVADGLRVVCHRVTGTLGKKIERVLVCTWEKFAFRASARKGLFKLKSFPKPNQVLSARSD